MPVLLQSGGRLRNIFIGIGKGYSTSYDNIDEESTMNKSQLFALLIVITLGLIIASIVYYDSDASIEMEQCGGCHNSEYTQKMASVGTWPAIFNTIVPDRRGERAKPCAEGHIRGCTECHTPTHGSMELHVGMTSSECSRCHNTPVAPMYTECTMCHGDYQHADSGITGDCTRDKRHQLRSPPPQAEPDNVQLRTAVDRRGVLLMSRGTCRIQELSGLP